MIWVVSCQIVTLWLIACALSETKEGSPKERKATWILVLIHKFCWHGHQWQLCKSFITCRLVCLQNQHAILTCQIQNFDIVLSQAISNSTRKLFWLHRWKVFCIFRHLIRGRGMRDRERLIWDLWLEGKGSVDLCRYLLDSSNLIISAQLAYQ